MRTRFDSPLPGGKHSEKGAPRGLVLSCAFLVCALWVQGAGAQAQTAHVPSARVQAPGQGEPYPVLYVQVASSRVRAAPSVAAPILAAVSYRQGLYAGESAEGWTRVLVPGTDRWGYIFSSALSPRPIGVPPPGSQPRQGVAGTEINLAGKGFSSNPENDAQAEASLSFIWVDRMESYSLDQSALVLFMQGR